VRRDKSGTPGRKFLTTASSEPVALADFEICEISARAGERFWSWTDVNWFSYCSHLRSGLSPSNTSSFGIPVAGTLKMK
jgi:hypothetical protein